MSNDLRQALQDLANTGADHAGPATILAGRATNRVSTHRRRRRAAISAATIAGMAAVGTGTAAAINYFGHDQVSTFPDRLVPGIEAPATLTGLLCDADVGDLTASTTPFSLTSERAVEAGDTPVPISVDAASIVPTFLTNETDDQIPFTMSEGSGVYLVQDGRVVAAPVRTDASPTDVILVPGESLPLLDDRVAPCDAAAGIPAGDYQAYSSIEVTVTGGAPVGTYDVVGGPWDVVVLPDGGSAADLDGLAVADSAAVFPQCGAMVGPADQVPPVHLTLAGGDLETTGEQPTVWLEVEATNTTSDHLLGYAMPVTLAVVRDGVVVGSVATAAAGDGGFIDLEPTAGLITPTYLDYTSCTPDDVFPGWLPAGEYSVWGEQYVTVTERTPVATDGTRGEPVQGEEELVAFNEVSTLIIEADGQPVFPGEG